MGVKLKKSNLMQRLSSWFEDHLPLRRRTDTRRADRSSSRKTSKSAAPRLRYSISAATAAATKTTIPEITEEEPFVYRVDDEFCAWQDFNRPTYSARPQMFPTGSLSQSFTSSVYSQGGGSCRQKIRTNPWVSGRERASMRNPNFQTLATHSKQHDVYLSPSPMNMSTMHTSAPVSGKNLTLTPNTLTPKPNLDLLYASMDRSGALRVKSLDESTCSSGYGSQDSSPESSVHSPDWQPSSQLQRHGLLEDKAIECRSIDVDEALGLLDEIEFVDQDPEPEPRPRHQPNKQMPNVRRSPYDDTGIYDPLDGFSKVEDEPHIYHELESLHRISMLLEDPDYDNTIYPHHNRVSSSACSSPIYAVPYEGSSTSSTNYSSPNKFRSNNDASPIYAKVWRDPNRASSSNAGVYQCVRRVADDVSKRCPLQIESPFYAHGANKSMGHDPNLSTAYGQTSEASPDSDFDFLAELDKQIAELQIQSDAVRQLVEQARERQDLRARTRQLCMEHINELRKMRWFMHNNFELCL